MKDKRNVLLFTIVIVVLVCLFNKYKEHKSLEQFFGKPSLENPFSEKPIENNVTNYYGNWPFEGQYVQDLNWAENYLYNYMNYFEVWNWENPVIVFDIDDTLVFTDPGRVKNGPVYNDYGIFGSNRIVIYPEISQMVNIAKFCQTKNVPVIIITARNEKMREASEKNCKLMGIHALEFYMNDGQFDFNSKARIRAELSKKYTIVATIGDQMFDVIYPGDSLAVKLPSREDRNCVIFSGKKID